MANHGWWLAAVAVTLCSSALLSGGEKDQGCVPEWSGRFDQMLPEYAPTLLATFPTDHGDRLIWRQYSRSELTVWDPEQGIVEKVNFGEGGLTLRSLALVGEGQDARLYLAGSFHEINGSPADGMAVYDGQTWTGIIPNHYAQWLTVADLGSGPELFSYVSDGPGTDSLGVARWADEGWVFIESEPSTFGRCVQLTSFDDGTGPALYATGSFFEVAGIPANGLAKWDGTEWSVPDDPPDPYDEDRWISVRGVLERDDLHYLIAVVASAYPPTYDDEVSLRAWTGIEWIEFPMETDAEEAWDLDSVSTVFDDGTGPALYLSGDFNSINGVPIGNSARFDGVNWSSFGDELGPYDVRQLATYDSAPGSSLLLAGLGPEWLAGMIVWEDGVFREVIDQHGIPFDHKIDRPVNAMVVDQTGTGERLVVGTYHWRSWPAGNSLTTLAWDGTRWSASLSVSGIGNVDVTALAYLSSDGGTQLYRAGRWAITRLVEEDQWELIGLSDDALPFFHDLETFDDGDGEALYLAGDFHQIEGVYVRNIAKWDGAHWSDPGWGVNLAVYDMAAFDDGTGPALYVGGEFTSAGFELIATIARWDGATWSAVGDGLVGAVYALDVFDDGAGPALYAGGEFTINGDPSGVNIARWNGETWQAVCGGVNGPVYAFEPYDDGETRRLYVGGMFTRAGITTVRNLASWSGSHWRSVKGGVGAGRGTPEGLVNTMAVHDDGVGDGPVLFLGGDFTEAGGVPSHCIARLSDCLTSPLTGDIDRDGDVDQRDLAVILALYGAASGDPNYDESADLNSDGVIDSADLGMLLATYGEGT